MKEGKSHFAANTSSPSAGREGNKRGRHRGKRAALAAGIVLAVLLLLAGALLLGGYAWFRAETADVKLDPALLPTAKAVPVVLDAHGEPLPYAADNYVKPGSLPRHVTDAFVAQEDRRFYSHKGYDLRAMARAALRNLKAGRTVEGASTITQQLVKNTHLSAERTLSRKMKEIALATKIEEAFSKEEILSMYLSVIYFGAGAYGINEASEVYFGCTPEELTLAQAATLAGLLKNPSAYSPKSHPDKALERRDLVLDVMYREGCIGEEERDRAKAEALVLANRKQGGEEWRYYVSAAVREACELLGITEYELANSGVTILTAYDADAQRALFSEAKSAANFSDGEVESEAVIADNATGEIVAVYSSTGYEVKRQAGSVMKPLAVYAPALDAGVITLATPLKDERTDFGGWSPENFGGKYYGDVLPREAMKRSLNTVAVKVLSYLGAERGAASCAALGLPVTERDAHLTLALGATEKGVGPIAIAGAYSAMAREGNFVRPHLVRAVVKDGRKVAVGGSACVAVFSPDTAALVTDCLADTAREGTAKALSSLPFDVAAKTGTVQKDASFNTDAWCVSYTSAHTLAVWHGGEKMTELGGGHPARHSSNIWKKLYSEETPAPFSLPRTVVKERVDVYSTFKGGRAVLALPNTPNEYVCEELFSRVFLPSSEGSRFLSASPALNVSAAGNGAEISFTAETPFIYALYCTDALGKRLVARLDGGTGALLPLADGPRAGASAAVIGEVSLKKCEKKDEYTHYPSFGIVVSHFPISFGGKVTYTLETVIKESGVSIGSEEKACFPSSYLPSAFKAR